MTRRLTAIVAVAAGLAVAGCGGDEEPGPVVDSPADSETSYLDDPCSRVSSERLKVLHVTDQGFEPPDLVLGAGVPVTWVNCGENTHRLRKVDGRGPGFDSGPIKPGEQFTRTFADIGEQRIRDTENPGAEIVVDVRGSPE